MAPHDKFVSSDEEKQESVFKFLETLSSDNIDKIRLIYFSLTWCDVNTFVWHYISNRHIISSYHRFLSGKRAPRIVIEIFVVFVLDVMNTHLDYIYGVIVDEIVIRSGLRKKLDGSNIQLSSL